MNRALVKRLLNQYLDGEIGLADKAELERLMAEDPEVRAEYKALRQIGLQLGTMPEIVPHKTRLRARVQYALDAEARTYFTPQRVFAGAMAVALVVIVLSFGMLVFQEGMLGTKPPPLQRMEAVRVPTPEPGGSVAVLDTWVDANRFFSRLLVENQLGMVDGQVLATISSQTNILEGAICDSNSLEGVQLSFPVRAIQVTATPSVAQQLSKVAEEVAGRPCPIAITNDKGVVIPMEQFLRSSSGLRSMNLMIRFK